MRKQGDRKKTGMGKQAGGKKRKTVIIWPELGRGMRKKGGRKKTGMRKQGGGKKKGRSEEKKSGSRQV
jgi:hypothetical protein